ncbi:malectin isoform X1 [Amblyraja radiata]|uniref:malectin isoform X1 n=2 Tax=Amblyraja radiata TaxID=386614 RepID=UPI001403DF4B|nr:malectin isoform X1 [Amblyraja radiata]
MAETGRRLQGSAAAPAEAAGGGGEEMRRGKPCRRSSHCLWLLTAALATARCCLGASAQPDKVVWAINAGGETHTDVHGIQFKRDPLEGKIGRASDYGMRLPIFRSMPEDQILYQTERYNEETFGYDIPIKEEGDYVLVLKFAEVYFAQSQQKVFDVRLNGQHVVVKDLDIFDKVGHSTAHDELVTFSVRKGKLSVQGEVSTFNGKLLVEFVKGYYDNPKVCAMCIIKGSVEDVPKLLPHPGLEKKEEEEEEEDYEEGAERKPLSKKKVKSGPRTPDPYASDNSSLMFPILVAFGVFIPTLFCLCRL